MIPTGSSVLLIFLAVFMRKKGLEPLLKAWQSTSIAVARTGWWLAMVECGDDSYLKRRVALAQPRGELPQVFVGGLALGPEKISILRDVSAFVLPCLLSAACNLPSAFLSSAVWEAPPHADLLAPMLDRWKSAAYSDLSALTGMGQAGQAGRALVAEHYSLSLVAKQIKQLFEWIFGGVDPPAFVSF